MSTIRNRIKNIEIAIRPSRNRILVCGAVPNKPGYYEVMSVDPLEGQVMSREELEHLTDPDIAGLVFLDFLAKEEDNDFIQDDNDI